MKRRNFLKLFPLAGIAAVFGVNAKAESPQIVKIKEGEYYKDFGNLCQAQSDQSQLTV